MNGRAPVRVAARLRRPLARLGLALCLLIGGGLSTARAQLSEDDLAALRARAKTEGWTFTVGESEASRRPLRELCGAAEPLDWRSAAPVGPQTALRSVPVSFDWRSLNGVTPIRNQGGCGSCWAFCAIGTMECAMKIATGTDVDLSEQWLVSCTNAGKCSGGWHTAAFNYLRCNQGYDPCGGGGAVLESAFPYVASNAACHCPYAHPYVLTSWAMVSAANPTIAELKQAIYEHGPIGVTVYADSAFQAYSGGVFNACADPGYDNHCVVLVGWENGTVGDGVWIMRNSWGSDWGEDGYMRIAWGCSRIGGNAAYVNFSTNDCNGNGQPDACEVEAQPALDCNHNQIPDSCDLAAGTSHDCTGNGTPDECEADCNHNGFRDDCDLAAGTSHDCTGNGTPDDCETDCNHNGFRDDCDLAAGTSHDCTGNGTPDECEIDCNHNGIRDDCDLAAGTSPDCNLNGVPDVCDFEQCVNPWNGFQGLSFQQPVNGLDLDGDGVAWQNPQNSAAIWVFGCESGDDSDLMLQVRVVTNPLEDSYVISDYFEAGSGGLPPSAQVYTLRYQQRLEGYLNTKIDWEVFFHDAASGKVVMQLELTSTKSTRVPADQRGKLLVKNPAGTPAFINTGVTPTVGACSEISIVSNRLAGTVQLYVNGVARLSPALAPLEAGAGRLDYFRARPVANGAISDTVSLLRLDAFELCRNGGTAIEPAAWDCNANGTLDACDVTSGFSADCNGNHIPQECEVGDFDADGDVDAVDYAAWTNCLTDPGVTAGPGCTAGDADCDGDVDLRDFAGFQQTSPQR